MVEHSVGELIEENIFVYCANNPINYTDHSGFSKGGKSQPLNDDWLRGKSIEELNEMYKREKDPARKRKIQQQQKYLRGRNVQKRNEQVSKIGVGIVAVGTGYLIYRGVRLLPSLFPPLWWTLPANLAIP